MTIIENFERFQYFKFEINFLKNAIWMEVHIYSVKAKGQAGNIWAKYQGSNDLFRSDPQEYSD